MAYTKDYILDAGPAGDTVKDAITVKVDGNIDAIFADLNTHEALTTGAHGVGSGTIVGTALTQTLTNKTISGGTLTGSITADSLTLVGYTPTLSGNTLTNATLTGTTAIYHPVLTVADIRGATLSGTVTWTTPQLTNPTITGATLTGTITGTGATYAGGTLSGTFTGGTITGATITGSTVYGYLKTVDSTTISSATLSACSLGSTTTTNGGTLAGGTIQGVTITGTITGTGATISGATLTGAITAYRINGLTLSPATTGFTIAGGTAPKTFTLDVDFTASAAGGAGETVGVVKAWAAAAAPTGYLECDGSSISTTTYSTLYSAIGTMYGSGAGVFKLPDYRGQFLRGWSHGQTTDPDKDTRTDRGDGQTGDYIGTKQTSSNITHTHTATVGTESNHTHTAVSKIVDTTYLVDAGLAVSVVRALKNSAATTTSAGTSHTHTSTINSQGGNESRPTNINVMWIIKY